MIVGFYFTFVELYINYKFYFLWSILLKSSEKAIYF